MVPFRLRSGLPTFVLLLETPTRVYREVLEGHQRKRFDQQLSKFLTGEPESAFEPVGKFPPPLRQLKDRGGNVRAIGTWCQNDAFDLLVVQAIYRKPDEDRFLARQRLFAERGVKLEDRFADVDSESFRVKADEWEGRDDVLVFSAADG